MSWTNLKQGIAAVVKTNNNQEITGANLQSTLFNIVDAVGQYATFVGVATTSTIPPSNPDGEIFYIAGPGTYPWFTNQGDPDVVVPEGYIGVFKSFGVSSWHQAMVKCGLSTSDVDTEIDTVALDNTTISESDKLTAVTLKLKRGNTVIDTEKIPNAVPSYRAGCMSSSQAADLAKCLSDIAALQGPFTSALKNKNLIYIGNYGNAYPTIINSIVTTLGMGGAFNLSQVASRVCIKDDSGGPYRISVSTNPLDSDNHLMSQVLRLFQLLTPSGQDIPYLRDESSRLICRESPEPKGFGRISESDIGLILVGGFTLCGTSSYYDLFMGTTSEDAIKIKYSGNDSFYIDSNGYPNGDSHLVESAGDVFYATLALINKYISPNVRRAVLGIPPSANGGDYGLAPSEDNNGSLIANNVIKVERDIAHANGWSYISPYENCGISSTLEMYKIEQGGSSEYFEVEQTGSTGQYFYEIPIGNARSKIINCIVNQIISLFRN